MLPTGLYLWVQALHVIAVIAWMAGLLYLPRLFVYHTQVSMGSETSETFKVMEQKLLKFIMNPAMIATWLFGLLMVLELGLSGSGQGWLHAKLLLVLGLSGVHGFLASSARKFKSDANGRSERFWRIFNEVPTLLMIVIVILVILKPF